MRTEKFLDSTIEEARRKSNVKHGVKYRFIDKRSVCFDPNSDKDENVSLLLFKDWPLYLSKLEMTGCIYHEIAGHLKYYEEKYPVYMVHIDKKDKACMPDEVFIDENASKEFNIKKMDSNKLSADTGLATEDVVFMTRFFNDSLIEPNVVLTMGPERWGDYFSLMLSRIRKINNSYFDKSCVYASMVATIHKAGNLKDLQRLKEQITVPREFEEVATILKSARPTYDEQLLNEQYLSLLSEARRLFDLNPFWSHENNTL